MMVAMRKARIPVAVSPSRLVTLSALLLLGGCGSQRRGGPTEIVYWTGWSGHEYEVQQRLIDEFNRTHRDVHVRMLTQFSGTGAYEKVKIAFAGGATPDVMSTIWDFELAGYAMRGVLEPLDGYLARTGRDVDREYTPGVARMLHVNGHVYGLTVTTNTTFIAYNRDIFRQCGLDPDHPPVTTPELDHAAQVTTQRAPDGRYLRFGFRPGDLTLWAYVFGGRWYDPVTGRVTANDAHNVEALRWMASYARMFDMPRVRAFEATLGSNETANGPFFVGKLVMWQTGEWAEEFIRRYGPGLQWHWMPLPYPSGGRPDTTPAGGSVFAIPTACKHKAAAWEFLNWITSPHAVTEFCSSIKNVPPLIESGKDAVFQKDSLFRFAIAIAQGQNSFGPPPIPIWATYRREIQRVEDAAVMGGGDPQQLLDTLQRNMDRELRRTLAELRPGT